MPNYKELLLICVSYRISVLSIQQPHLEESAICVNFIGPEKASYRIQPDHNQHLGKLSLMLEELVLTTMHSLTHSYVLVPLHISILLLQKVCKRIDRSSKQGRQKHALLTKTMLPAYARYVLETKMEQYLTGFITIY